MSNSATPWTAAYQAPPSTGFSRQKYWSGVPFPSPRDTHLSSVPLDLGFRSFTCHLEYNLSIFKCGHTLYVIGRRQWHPTPVLLPGKSHGWRSLVGCSPWGREELDTTERLHFHFSLSCIGEGNGNPLQCSCLENPMDRGAWRATAHGVAKVRNS